MDRPGETRHGGGHRNAPDTEPDRAHGSKRVAESSPEASREQSERHASDRGTSSGRHGDTDQVQHKAGGALHQAQQKAGQVGAQVQEQAKPRLKHQKDVAAEQIDGIAHALRETGHQLREQNRAGIAQYVDQGAERIEQFAGHLRERDINQLVRETEQFARRQPAIFLAGAFTLGFLGARLFKGAGEQGGSDEGTRPHRAKTAAPARHDRRE